MVSPCSGNITLPGLVMATVRPPASSSRLSASLAIASTVPHAAAAQTSRAARSAMARTAAWTGPVVMDGMTEASATLSPATPWTRKVAVDHRRARVAPHRAGAHGMVVGHGRARHERVDVGVVLHGRAGQQLGVTPLVERRPASHLACEAQRRPEPLAVPGSVR